MKLSGLIIGYGFGVFCLASGAWHLAHGEPYVALARAAGLVLALVVLRMARRMA